MLNTQIRINEYLAKAIEAEKQGDDIATARYWKMAIFAEAKLLAMEKGHQGYQG